MAKARTGGDILDLGSWVILRMASADTLRVFNSLRDGGLEVWTPVEPRFGRMPRTRAKYDKDFAIMPSYVFGHVRHLDELLRLAMTPNREHPAFSVFHHKGGIPLVADNQLDALRYEEGRLTGIFERLKRRGMKGPTIETGTEVHMTDGPFQGLTGVVEGQNGQYTLVSFGGFHKPIQIASLLLAEDGVCGGQSERDDAAEAA
jgi:hypothetical protein